MWPFQHATLLGFAVLAGCQLSAPLSAEPLDASAADESRSEAASELLPGCRDGEICLASTETAEGACAQALSLLVASGKLSAPAACDVLGESGQTGSSRAAILGFRQAEFERPYFVAFDDGAGFRRLVPLMNVASGINTDLNLAVVHVAFEDLVPGGARELRIELQSVVNDHDCSGEFSWRTERRDLGLCGLNDAGEPYCVAPLPRALRRFETHYDPRTDRETTELIEQVAFDLSFATGMLIAKVSTGSIPDEMHAIVGRHGLDDLSAVVSEMPFPN